MIFYLLNKSQKVLKAISSNQVIEAHFVEGINQAGQLTLSLPLQNRLDPNIFFALCQKPDSTEYLLFKLISEEVQKDRITYQGVDAAYDELKGYGYVTDIRPVQSTAKEILQRVLQGTRWEVGYIDATNPIDTSFYYQNYLGCIQQIVQLFNLEVTFTYGFDTKSQEITSRNVNLYLQQGRRTGKRFEYGSNLLEVTREEDNQNIITALVGRGKGIEEYDDTGTATGGYSRRISFSNVVWSKANGDPVDKPAGQEYVEDPEATKIFGYDDEKPRTGIIEFDDIEDPVELLKATWTSLKSSDHPKVSFKAQVTDVGDLQLGDTIAIIRHEISIEYFTRVFKVDHDLLNKNNSIIEMGDDMSGRSLYSYISDVDTTAKQAVQDANQAVVAAGFKSKNYYSTTKPAIANEGDNLWLNLGNGEFEHWVWHNNQWQFINSTQDLHNVEKNVENQQAELEKVKQSVNDASGKIDNLNQNTTANIATINTSLKSAQDDIANAKNEIQDNGGKIVSVNKKVDDLSVTVGNNTASISKVDQKADQIKATVASNTSSISTVTQTANNVSSIINDENTGLSAVLQKVNYVSSIVNDKENGLSAVNQKADSLSTAIVGKADISQVTQLSDQIKTKVESKDFTSQIDQLNNNINLKVSKGDVLGQINIEAGSTLIQNKKLYLDADSVVFSGKAFIPDAAIVNISADKINAGTLDAGKINVINLNADNIVAGALSGKNISMNLTTGRVVFTSGRFYNQDETFDINVDENYIRSSQKTNYIYIGDSDSVEKKLYNYRIKKWRKLYFKTCFNIKYC
nr:phage tail spike protein [Lactobacillus helveticus]